MTAFNIKVVSDVICPWCYVGKKRLERAVSLYQKTLPGGSSDTFTITWHPYYLDPSLPKVGVDPEQHLHRKFSPQRVAMMHQVLSGLGEAEGIHFTWKGKIGNTRDAHRLVQLAKTKSIEAEDRLVSELFRSHFEEDGDLTSEAVLLDVAERAGLDRPEAKSWLQSGGGGQEVDEEVQQAYRAGIHGVPHFTINGRYHISGAEDVQTFLEEFTRAKQTSARESGKPTVSGGSGVCLPESQ